jgi:hypothetical protein
MVRAAREDALKCSARDGAHETCKCLRMERNEKLRAALSWRLASRRCYGQHSEVSSRDVRVMRIHSRRLLDPPKEIAAAVTSFGAR